jgi:hypothetical protein
MKDPQYESAKKDTCLLNVIKVFWSRLSELNRRPSNYESDALPTELSRLGSRATALYGRAVSGVKQPNRA